MQSFRICCFWEFEQDLYLYGLYLKFRGKKNFKIKLSHLCERDNLSDFLASSKCSYASCSDKEIAVTILLASEIYKCTHMCIYKTLWIYLHIYTHVYRSLDILHFYFQNFIFTMSRAPKICLSILNKRVSKHPGSLHSIRRGKLLNCEMSLSIKFSIWQFLSCSHFVKFHKVLGMKIRY